MSYSKKSPEQFKQENIQYWTKDIFNKENLEHLYEAIIDTLEAPGKKKNMFLNLNPWVNWKRGDVCNGIYRDKFIRNSKEFALEHIISFPKIKELIETKELTLHLIVGPYTNSDPRHSRQSRHYRHSREDVDDSDTLKVHFNVLLCFDKNYSDKFIAVRQSKSFKKKTRRTFVDPSKVQGYSQPIRKSTRKSTRKTTPSDTHIDHVVNSDNTSNPFEALSEVQEEQADVKDDSDIKTYDVDKDKATTDTETGSDEAAGTVDTSPEDGELEIEE